MKQHAKLSAAVCCFATLGLTSCAVGPDYLGPAPMPTVNNYGEKFKRAETSDRSPLPARWWETLKDPLLTQLVDRALSESPDIKVATAKLDRARAVAAEQQANRLPSTSASAIGAQVYLPSGTILSSGGSGGRTESGFYNLGFNASWEIDLFGGRKRAAEGAVADAQAAEATLADAHVALAAQVAATYVDFRSLQNQEGLLRESVELLREAIRLEQARVRYGTSSKSLFSESKARIENERAELAVIQAERTATADRLALLTGLAPGALDEQFQTWADIPLPPPEVNVGDPAELLRRRPDVRASERALAAANAKIGSTIAQRFPSVSFFGLLGLGGSNPGDVVDVHSLSTILLPRINWSFMDFGRTAARVQQSKASFAEAESNYERSVLVALNDTEQSLVRFGGQRNRFYYLTAARQETLAGEELSHDRLVKGTVSRIGEIEAIRRRLQADRALANASADLTKAFITVQKSLGIGWVAPNAIVPNSNLNSLSPYVDKNREPS